MVLIPALDAEALGELWIVPRRHLASCLEARASEWLEVLAMVELAQQHPPLIAHAGRYRLEIPEPSATDLSPPHLCIRLVPDLT